MLKGTEALALALLDLGFRRIYTTAGDGQAGLLRRVEGLILRHAPLAADEPPGEDEQAPLRRALSDALAVHLALGGGLLSGHATCALLSPAGLGGALPGLGQAGAMNEYRSPVVLVEGPGEGEDVELDNRPALAHGAHLPILETGGADEVYHLLALAAEVSAQGGMPVVVRVPARALRDRAEVRKLASSAASATAADPEARPGAFCRADAPYLYTGAARAFHRAQRGGRLRRLEALSEALVLATGAEGAKRGVLLAGHLPPRAQALCAARGVPSLRLGMAWPLPARRLLEFLAPLQEVLVLEEGGPFLLAQVRALAQESGLRLQVRAPAGTPGASLDDAAVGAEIGRFAADAGAAEGAQRVPAHDLSHARGVLASRPLPDARGEVEEEPWGLYLARVARPAEEAGPMPEAGRLRLLLALEALRRPVMLVGGPAVPPGGPGPLLAALPGRGAIAPLAGALAEARVLLGGGLHAEERPVAVALLDGEAEYAAEYCGMADNALRQRDVLHVLLGAPAADAAPGPASLFSLGMEILGADLEDEEGLRSALAYAAQRRGPRLLLLRRPQPGSLGQSSVSPSETPAPQRR